MPTVSATPHKPSPRRKDPAKLRAAFSGRAIGPHLQLTAGLLRGADRAIAIGATAAQVFVDNPTAWRRKPEPPVKLAEFRARLAAAGIGPLAVHASYLVNLAAASEEFRQKSIETLVAELRMGRAYGAFAVNVHIGSHVGQGATRGTELVGEGIAAVLAEVAGEPDTPRLVLENSAGAGGTLGSSLPEIAAVLNAAMRAGATEAQLGVCLDTAHLWGFGYDLSDPGEIDALLASVDAELGPTALAMLHLNDSRAARGSKADRHEHIGAGTIGERGLAHLIAHPRLAAVPMYLETPGMDAGYDAVNLERVRRLIRGEPLKALPKKAFTTKKGRPRTPTRTSPPDEPAPGA